MAGPVPSSVMLEQGGSELRSVEFESNSSAAAAAGGREPCALTPLLTESAVASSSSLQYHQPQATLVWGNGL